MKVFSGGWELRDRELLDQRPVFADAGSSPTPTGWRWFPATSEHEAARQLIAWARAIADATSAEAVALSVGHGALASLLATMLPVRDEEAPDTIVELSGSSVTIAECLGRLADRGTLVMTTNDAADPLILDTYPDIHRRSLTLVGVDLDDVQPDRVAADDPAIDLLLAQLVVIEEGVTPPVAAWYRILPARRDTTDTQPSGVR
jgi:threonine dehydrogenase-like Zn-dependent dehydrogenase